LLVQIPNPLANALVAVQIPPLDTLFGPLTDATRLLASVPEDALGLLITFPHGLTGIAFGLQNLIDGPFSMLAGGWFLHRRG
jgi:hypothetical protein